MKPTILPGLRRLAAACLGFALVGAAVMRTNRQDPLQQAAYLETTPEAQTHAGLEKAVQLYREALRLDNASPYRWADLAEALAAAGQMPEATRCFDRAMALAPSIPYIWVRHANFCFMQDQPQQALSSATRVLATVPNFDAVLFSYFDSMIDDPAVVAAAIAGQPRTMQSWLKHLMLIRNSPAAALAWTHISGAGHPDISLASAYVRFLLDSREFTRAQEVWSEWLGSRRGDYPSRNLIFNDHFQSVPTDSPLDWSITQPKDAQVDFYQTAREAEGMRIQFNGKANISYDNLSQIVVLPRAGRYRLTARVKTAGITTNEGPRLAIPDLNLTSDSLTGTHGWIPLTLEFTASQPRTVRVAIIRRPSERFDNKISGTFWISSMVLEPANASISGY